jgi:hypothetical protein
VRDAYEALMPIRAIFVQLVYGIGRRNLCAAMIRFIRSLCADGSAGVAEVKELKRQREMLKLGYRRIPCLLGVLSGESIPTPL